MRKFFTTLAVLTCFTPVLAVDATAAGMCGYHADVVKELNDKFQESGRAIGIAGQINLVEVFASKAGTWTILFTTPQGKTCIIAAGNSWEDLPPSKNLTAL